ncbi:Gfo/Idh/MocA family oxidoreductase [Pseudoflavitalea sp. G-6-1-2]|uniref:Gfo/Idh/MocA family protein n=1 Tax=Pseudoflavitalea sp. G-6-1-2 TaxID=2728841 RepID=UPI00146BF9D0|nr:Gfo/Idh/MocA family oxidoreductase [Pseudoflavitalea sp. G-6-1-2]NML19744.1 Gfo/Idh/MocA family oxidoreductase [Pseudoflavitalea sp. G-6-1-2]
MSKPTQPRRAFIQKIGKGVAASALLPGLAHAADNLPHTEWLSRKYVSPNDNLQIALIGAGGMGNGDAQTATSIPGVKLVAACDLYDGCLENAKKKYGNDIFTTKDYREVLNRKDIDAVIVATPDHWHKDISVDAMNAGKAVYCEKPMVHDVSEGPAVIAAQAKNKVVFQVGSQGMSSLGNEKAKELYEAGAIGQLNYAEGVWARNTPGGAWQYDMPADGNLQTVDWKRFLHGNPDIPFDPKKFFRWRCFKDYGTGVAGDLFVHLFSSLHYVVSSSGPNRIMSTGGLRYWKDGREVPDILLGMFDYPQTANHPAFNLSLRVNFVDGTGESNSLRLVGNEGSMIVDWDKVTLIKNKFWPPDQYAKYFAERRYDKDYDRKTIKAPETTVFKVDEGYKGAHYDHFFNWVRAIRGGKPVIEDAVFGYRAAAPALLCNDSYYKERAIKWDPISMKLIG